MENLFGVKSFMNEVESKLISLLQDAQKREGYLSEQTIESIHLDYNIPKARIYGVATFYSQFRLKPLGRNTIKLCRGTACHVAGSFDLLHELREYLGLKEDNDTTRDLRFTLEEVACLGCCSLAPAIMINETVYGRLDINKMKKILAEYK